VQNPNKKGRGTPRPSQILEVTNQLATAVAVNPPPSALFQTFLLPGERIVWTGRPKQGFALHKADAFLIPFSWLWLGFIVFFFLMFPTSADDEVPVFPVIAVFLAIGIYAAFGRFIHDAIIRSRLSYAITDQRVLFMRGSRRFSSLDLKQLPRLELAEHGDKSGTIRFENSPSLLDGTKTTDLTIWLPTIASLQFFRIREPRKVYQLIRDHAART
jgi:hypothetical protein